MIKIFQNSTQEINTQILKYLVIGGLNFITDFLILFILVDYFKFEVILAATISYACGLIVHFNLNRYWNFRNFERTYLQHLRTYLVATAFFYVINILSIKLFLMIGIYYLLAKILSTMITACLTFATNKYITFSNGIRYSVIKLIKELKNNN